MSEKTLFEYTITPDTVYITKDPLNPSIAKLTIGVANDTESDIECDWTSIIIPIGEGASDLASTAGSIQTSSSRPAEWIFQPVSGAPGQFIAEPVFPNTGLKAGGSVTFELSNINVNRVLGSPKIRIIELTDDRREDSRFLNKSVSNLRIDPTDNSIFVPENGWQQREEDFSEAAKADVELERTVFDYVVSPHSVYITRDPHNPSVARLDIAVNNNTGSDIECDWISFITIPGQGGSALTAQPGSIKPSSSKPNEWAITPIDGAPGQFIAEPIFPNTGLKAGDTVSFRLDSIIVNGEIGGTNFDIAEKVEDIRGKLVLINKIQGTLRIEYFRSEPTAIKPGGSSKLTWKTVDAAECILSWPTGSEKVDLSGSKDVEPSDTTIYTLTAKGGLGPDVSEQRAVVVNKVIIVLEAKPIAVGLDGSSVLTWQVLNSDPGSCRLDPGDLPVGPVGEKMVTLNRTTPYTISARGGNQFDFKQVIISVEPPRIRDFRAATPEKPGARVTLSWDTQYAESVSIDQGVGQVPHVGSTEVSNVNETTYTLTCLGLGDPVKRQVTVPGNKVRIVYLTTVCIDTPYACNNLFFGVRFDCRWQTEFATSTRLIRVKDNTVVATQSGQYTYGTRVPATGPEDEFRLVAEGPGGPAERKIMLGWGLVSE